MEQTFKYNRATRNFVRYEAAFEDGNVSGNLYVPLSEVSEPYPPEIIVTVSIPEPAPVKKAPARKPAQKTVPRKRTAASSK